MGSEAVEYASGSFDKDQNVYVGAAHLNSGGKTHRVGIYILRYFKVSCILQAKRIEPDSYFKRTRRRQVLILTARSPTIHSSNSMARFCILLLPKKTSQKSVAT